MKPTLPRTSATRLHNTTQTLPPRKLAPCPCCHEPLQNTALHCAHCGAEKHYGPRVHELIIYALSGLALCLALIFLLTPQSFSTASIWLYPLLGSGLTAGFLLAQFRFSGERWIQRKKK